MIVEGLWVDRKQRLKRIHQPRSRRECVGELVQIDGCEHWWFEDRGPQCTLLVFVDDATGRLMHLHFVESESTFSYFHATRAYLESWGKPIAFYSDKHGVFRVNHEGAIGGDGMTQFGRALDALNIEIICANSSQAKGRVERAHKTLQDRLVKELRLAGASSLAEGNALLPAFMADYNARFAKPPANGKDLHRPLRDEDNLEDAFAWKEECTLSRALTLQYARWFSFSRRPIRPRRRSASGLPCSIIPMAGCRSATKVSSWLTAPSTSCGRSRRPRLSRTSGSAPFSPLSASSRLHGRNPAARRPRAAAIRAMRDCSKSAEFLYKPSELMLARGPCGGRRAGAALRTGSAPTRRPKLATVTFLNGRNSDISKRWTHVF